MRTRDVFRYLMGDNDPVEAEVKRLLDLAFDNSEGLYAWSQSLAVEDPVLHCLVASVCGGTVKGVQQGENVGNSVGVSLYGLARAIQAHFKEKHDENLGSAS